MTAHETIVGPPLTLRLAATLAVLETIGEAIAIGWNGNRTWPLRIALIIVISTQVLFAVWARRFSPGATFGLFAYQIAAVVAALASHAAVAPRALLGASAVATFVLLAASLPSYPSPEIQISRGPR